MLSVVHGEPSESIFSNHSIEAQPHTTASWHLILGGRQTVASADALFPGLEEAIALVSHHRRPSDLEVELAVVSGRAVGDLVEEATNGIGFKWNHDSAPIVEKTSAVRVPQTTE
jgi:hypothetical protein